VEMNVVVRGFDSHVKLAPPIASTETLCFECEPTKNHDMFSGYSSTPYAPAVS